MSCAPQREWHPQDPLFELESENESESQGDRDSASRLTFGLVLLTFSTLWPQALLRASSRRS